MRAEPGHRGVCASWCGPAGYEGRVHQGFLNFTLEVLPDVST